MMSEAPRRPVKAALAILTSLFSSLDAPIILFNAKKAQNLISHLERAVTIWGILLHDISFFGYFALATQFSLCVS
jgi:hypothetical protein